MTDDLKGDRPEWARYRRPTSDAGGSGAGDADGPSAEPEPELRDAAADDQHNAADDQAAASGDPVPAVDYGAPAPNVIPDPVVAAASHGLAGATDAGPPAATTPPAMPAPTAWDPGPPLPNEVEARIRRDLARGRWIVRLTWIAAFASLVLGLVALRQGALLVAIDRRLVTTEEVQAASASFDVARAVLIATIGLGAALAIRWLRGALPVIADLQARGVIDGPAPRSERFPDRVVLLWRGAGVPADRAGWSDLRVGPGRRLTLLTSAVVLLAIGVGLVAAVWLGAARDADTSRLLRVVSGLDGGLWLIASVLVGVVIDGILWREAAAARALGVFIPLVDAPARAAVRLIPPILAFAAGVAVASGRPDPWFVPCPEATLSCDGMLVPVDHDGGSNATIWIVYAIHRAESAPVGTLAIAVGGPGISGLDQSLAIIDDLDPTLVRRYDLLFFDQRGVGASEGRECRAAGAAYAESPPGADAARTFASDCVAEAGVDPSSLARYATRQAAEDLESIRLRLGVERLAVYGESYGTELAQAYAAAHPDRVSALILDGAVDLTRSANAFWADAAIGFSDVLDATFDSCLRQSDCRADVADPAPAYDDLVRQFATARDVEFGDPDGTVRTHAVDAVELESAVDALLYEPAGRMLIQRAVAAAGRGDTVPAARLVAAFGGPGSQGSGSSFAYHAITCADYRVSPTADPHDLAAVEAAAVAAGVTKKRTDEVYTSQYPCLYWPYQPPDATRPAPLTTTSFPVFVLGATDDPITPIDQARAIVGRLSDAYLIVTNGGPHVTFGRHRACVDDPVVAFLVDGRRPERRSITCDGEVAARYVPLTSTTETGLGDALDTMAATEPELFADPFYRLWDGAEDLQIGCRHGGFVAISPGTGQDRIRFAECAFVAGLAWTGSGTYDFASGLTSWKLASDVGDLDYVSNPDSRHVTGTWNGETVDLTR